MVGAKARLEICTHAMWIRVWINDRHSNWSRKFQVNSAVHAINMTKLYLHKEIVDFSYF
jgi:hypothetical protein